MRAYISIADAAECTRRQGQGARGPGCGLGWVRASSGRTGLRVDATRGAQDWVGCHSRDILLIHLYKVDHLFVVNLRGVNLVFEGPVLGLQKDQGPDRTRPI